MIEPIFLVIGVFVLAITVVGPFFAIYRYGLKAALICTALSFIFFTILYGVLKQGFGNPAGYNSGFNLLKSLKVCVVVVIPSLLLYVGFHYVCKYSKKIGLVWPIYVFTMIILAIASLIYWIDTIREAFR